MKKIILNFTLIILIILFAFVSGCKSMPLEVKTPSLSLTDKGVFTSSELVDFFMSVNPDGNSEKVARLAKLYIKECNDEGINSDCAFIQMCLETGFLRFGNLVKEEMNNFCGLGAINAEQPGLSFATEELGVRAHVQHLHAYGSTEPLKKQCIDPRYKYVSPRGKAPTIHGLAGTWAADKEYGVKLENLLLRLANKN